MSAACHVSFYTLVGQPFAHLLTNLLWIYAVATGAVTVDQSIGTSVTRQAGDVAQQEVQTMATDSSLKYFPQSTMGMNPDVEAMARRIRELEQENEDMKTGIRKATNRELTVYDSKSI